VGGAWRDPVPLAHWTSGVRSLSRARPGGALRRPSGATVSRLVDPSTLLDYGGTVFEGERRPPRSRAYRIAGYLDDLDALRLTFLVNERAGVPEVRPFGGQFG
jgi:hypothetical protein